MNTEESMNENGALDPPAVGGALPKPGTGSSPGAESTLQKTLPKIIGFETLARCGDEIWIENNGQIYRLRKTRQGKLILTK